MKRFAAAALTAAAAALVEIALPGRPVYHAGWYNVAVVAFIGVAIVTGRSALKSAKSARGRGAIVAILIGAVACGGAAVVSGLFAPDNREFAGVPGERVRVEELGTIVFPIAADSNAAVTLERPLHRPIAIGERRVDAGNFMLRTLPRDVVEVEARDARGNALTITQPQGSVFLSPILLMQHTQTIAGMELPFDSFNVPAARRVVKAIAFTPAQTAVMLHGIAPYGETAVLFSVDDENDKPLRGGVGLSAGGRPVRLGGLSLIGRVTSYPEVEAVAVPNAVALAIGALLLAGGFAGLGLPGGRVSVPR